MAAPVAPTAPVDRPEGRRATISERTLRTDRWWVSPLISFVILLAFVGYATWAAVVNRNYYYKPYISPFYSPCLATKCGTVPGSEGVPHLSIFGPWWAISPAIIILIFPLGFRLTCYYYRRAYYRAFWLSPPACAVAEPHARYSGETRFPLILQNVHRYFFYFGVIFNCILTYDAVVAFGVHHGGGHFGLGNVVLIVNAGAPLGLLAVVPLLPAHHRRPAQALLQAPHPVQDVGLRIQAQSEAHAARVGFTDICGPDGPLRPPRGQRLIGTWRLDLMTDYEHHSYDVIVVGAGGAGLRAAIAANDAGARTAVICKSLLGKAHTVMAEGGIAAAMGNLYPEDNWQVHFRDTMRGGKLLNHWRMAELHAKEAPERVWELEQWGALFDRTADGLISQRDFGGHRYARLAHVGDRTGLEMIRTLQQRTVALGVDVFMECTVTDLLKDGDRISGAFGYWRESGRFVVFDAPAVVLATGGIGKSWKVTSNSWEYTGDGHALALRAGAGLVNMEFVQFHPTGMVWPPSVRGILVTESVRGDGGILKNSDGERFMFNYIPEFFKAETADSVEEADRWYTDKRNNRRPPELLPRDEVARAINSEIKAGRGSPHGGVFLDIASRRTPEYIQKRLPSMYHQFKELAEVDITKEPMEIGPTCHYVMGGVEVEPDSAVSKVTGLYAAGEVAGGMHGANRLGGNSLGDLLVFGKRAGEYAAEYARSLGSSRPAVAQAHVDTAAAAALAPFNSEGGENPYSVHQALQAIMQDLVGIIRTEAELKAAIDRITDLRARVANVTVEGHRQYNPGWHLAIDLSNMLLVSDAVAKAALERKESRGGHTRDDYPMTDYDFWGKLNLIIELGGLGEPGVRHQKLPEPPPELAALLEEQH